MLRRILRGDVMPYRVLVADNYHYMDESEIYELGVFATRDEAVAACARIVDEFLRRGHRPGMNATELFEGWLGFGEDPYVVPDDERPRFSARDYAKRRCAELCAKP